MPRTVILGAAGFLGSHLCDRFLERGHEVVAVDSYVTGTPLNLAHLEGQEGFSFVKHDITTYIDLEGPVDFILNFASPASPIDYLEMPIHTLKVGALGTHNGLGFAVKKKARFLQASTSEVYGDPLVHPQPESYLGNVDPIGPRGVYDEGKRYGEALVMAYHQAHGLDTRIVRIFNTYGPRMRLNDGRVVPAFIDQVLEGKPLSIFGDGQQTRSFCYVQDLIDGIESLLFSEEITPVNIGNPDERSVLSLAEELQAIAGTKLPLEFHGLPVGDPKVRCPKIDKAKALLGWSPKVNLQEGLTLTLEHYRALRARRAETA